jgi:hypothetical protein
MIIEEFTKLDTTEEKRVRSKDSFLHFVPVSFLSIHDKEKINYRGVSLKTVHLSDLLHGMLLKYHFNEVNEFPLSAIIMKQKYGKNYNYLVEFLLKAGFMVKVWNYKVGRNSNIYSLSEKVLDSKLTRRRVTDTVMLKKYKARYMQDCVESESPISLEVRKRLVSDLDRVQIDLGEAVEHIEKMEDGVAKDRNLYSIYSIDSGHLFYHFDHYGRMHTNFTILKSEVRKNHLFIDGVRTKECDIPNSQPMFLYKMMRDSKTKWVDESELTFYGELLMGGIFYDYFMGVAGLSRKEVKKMIYRVFFGKNHWNSKADGYFGKHFPTIHNYIKLYKKEQGDYRTLAYKLQRQESEFMFNHFLPIVYLRLPDVPFVTVHDSVLYPEYVDEQVREIFRTSFNSYMLL